MWRGDDVWRVEHQPTTSKSRLADRGLIAIVGLATLSNADAAEQMKKSLWLGKQGNGQVVAALSSRERDIRESLYRRGGHRGVDARESLATAQAT